MNKNIFWIVCAIVIITSMHSVLATKDIALSLDSKEYTFDVGQNAVITLHSNNTYGKDVTGQLSYTITQQIQQGGFSYSSKNTKATSMTIPDGENGMELSFGTSQQPLTLQVSLRFSYTEKDAREVNLDDIQIHFIKNKNTTQQNNQQKSSSQQSQNKKVSSSSQKAASQKSPASQDQQSMQQMINQMFNNQQQPQNQQNTQQKLQNNQAPQDSSALKKEMEQQLQEQNAMKKAFQKNLAQNSDFQKEHQQMLNKGYNISGGSLNPTTNVTGDFDLKYNSSSGKAELKGHMENRTLTSLQKKTPELEQEMLQKLEQTAKFKKYNADLKKQGYTKQGYSYDLQTDKATLDVTYTNGNATADITADAINDSIENVELVADTLEQKKQSHVFWIVLLIVLAIIGWIAYTRWHKSLKKKTTHEIHIVKKEPFDYMKESRALLATAKKHFEQKEYKDAYSSAAQALRIYLSYYHGLDKEVTSDDIIQYLRTNKKKYEAIKNCFDTCALVEFAKYEANEKDFRSITTAVEHVIFKKEK